MLKISQQDLSWYVSKLNELIENTLVLLCFKKKNDFITNMGVQRFKLNENSH